MARNLDTAYFRKNSNRNRNLDRHSHHRDRFRVHVLDVRRVAEATIAVRGHVQAQEGRTEVSALTTSPKIELTLNKSS